MEAYYIIPFWMCIALALRLVFGGYTALFLASILFASSEFLRARKTDVSRWKEFSSGAGVIGHRCCAIDVPENTVAALQKACSSGMKAVEIDLTMTKDNEPIVFHDDTLDRTTNGKGLVSAKTWAEIQQLQVSQTAGKSVKFTNERIPHLKEMLEECKRRGVKVFLDVKYDYNTFAIVNVVQKMKEQFPDLHQWLTVCSFYPNVIYAVKWYLPEFSVIQTHRPGFIAYTSAKQDEFREKSLHFRLLAPIADRILEALIYNYIWYFCGINAVFINDQQISVREMRFWQDRGVDVFIWTVNDPKAKEYLASIGLSYLTDDC